jgi:putative addiction module CopG family antidote
MNGKYAAMTIQLSPETEALIQELMDRGDYAHPAAVIDEALQALVEREKLTRLRALIAVGDEQAARGQVVAWTDDLLDRLKRQSEEDVRLGKPFKDEVIP